MKCGYKATIWNRLRHRLRLCPWGRLEYINPRIEWAPYEESWWKTVLKGSVGMPMDTIYRCLDCGRFNYSTTWTGPP